MGIPCVPFDCCSRYICSSIEADTFFLYKLLRLKFKIIMNILLKCCILPALKLISKLTYDILIRSQQNHRVNNKRYSFALKIMVHYVNTYMVCAYITYMI